MSEETEFDEERIAAMERIYRTTSMVERRQRVRDALALKPGEHVLSVGTGPGFESRGLAKDVGENGRVHGIDTAEPMLATARERCEDQPWATFEQGDAANLPIEDGAFDAAAAVQVYEYVPDLNTAFDELYRALRPGGRAVVLTSDTSTMTYHAADEARSEQIVDTFAAHYTQPRLARTIKPKLEQANFEVNDQDVYVHFETELTEDAVSGAFIPALKEIATEQGGVDEVDVEAWVDDLHERAEAGEYFFNYNQYLFVVEKP
ncbi:methyltransferase domain-containing protein [Salinirubellus sp. GCM10025818]|uniref:methyltransferase domain-containing protein n=1 Tax=Salinirubellus TaxID=2162630 RepID=UPI0030CA6470